MLKYDVETTQISVVVSNNPLPSFLGNVGSTSDVRDDDWQYIAGTYDGTTMNMYVDGELEGTLEYTDGYLPNDEPLFISFFQYGYNDGHGSLPNILNGEMDDVRIYDRALSQSDVQMLVPEPTTMMFVTIDIIALNLRGR